MKKALVVIDMQNDFIDGVLGNDECKATVPEVVKLIEEGNYDALVYSQDTHGEDYLETQEGKNLPVIHCIKNTDGWKLNQHVADAIEAYRVNRDGSVFGFEKNTFGGLVLTDILKTEELKDYDEIHFCGVCTGICVISNVMLAKATLPEVKLCVVEKACACVTPETHKTAIDAIKTCQVAII